MKRLIPILGLALIALMAVPAAAEDEESAPPEDKQKMLLDTLYQGSRYDGALHRVAEYEDIEPNAFVQFFYANSPYSSTPFELRAHRLTHDHQGAEASLDVNRVFGVEASFDSLLHRLDHDPLANLQAVSDVKVTRRTDFEPGVEYQVRHQMFDTGLTFRPPAASWLSLRAGLREQKREGVHQVLAVSHCTSCHVTSRGREIDQSTTDLRFGAHATFGRVDLDYEMLSRDFEEDGATPTAPYERAYHPGNPPGSLAAPFDDRLWFQNGDFAVNQIPEAEKLAHKFKAAITGKKAHSAQFTYVQSTNENVGTDMEYTFTGYRGRYQWRPKKNMRFIFHARRNVLDNDEAKVNLLAMNGLTSAPVSGYPDPADPNNTIVLRYQQWRRLVEGSNVNFTRYTRESAMDRTDDRAGVDWYWRPIRKGSLRLGYEYRLVDRDNVILADETGETTTHRFRAGWNQRFGKRVRWNSNVEYLTRDNAYASIDGGRRAFLVDPNGNPVGMGAGSPKAPSSLQYYQLHDLRVADLTNIPSQTIKVRSQATWSPRPNVAVSGSVRYRDSENDELDYSEWTQERAGLGASLWVAPDPRVQITLGADWEMEDTGTRFHVPLMDG